MMQGHANSSFRIPVDTSARVIFLTIHIEYITWKNTHVKFHNFKRNRYIKLHATLKFKTLKLNLWITLWIQFVLSYVDQNTLSSKNKWKCYRLSSSIYKETDILATT